MPLVHTVWTQRVAELCVALSANKCLDLVPAPGMLDFLAFRTHRRNPLESIDPLIGPPQLRLGLFQLSAPLERCLESREEQIDDLQPI